MRTVPNALTHERVAVFVDYHNTLNALRRVGRQIDLVALHDYLAEPSHVRNLPMAGGDGPPASASDFLATQPARNFSVGHTRGAGASASAQIRVLDSAIVSFAIEGS